MILCRRIADLSVDAWQIKRSLVPAATRTLDQGAKAAAGGEGTTTVADSSVGIGRATVGGPPGSCLRGQYGKVGDDEGDDGHGRDACMAIAPLNNHKRAQRGREPTEGVPHGAVGEGFIANGGAASSQGGGFAEAETMKSYAAISGRETTNLFPVRALDRASASASLATSPVGDGGGNRGLVRSSLRAANPHTVTSLPAPLGESGYQPPWERAASIDDLVRLV